MPKDRKTKKSKNPFAAFLPKKNGSAQRAADKLAQRMFSKDEHLRGDMAKKSLRKNRTELAIGVKPRSPRQKGLSGAEKGFLQRMRKGKRI